MSPNSYMCCIYSFQIKWLPSPYGPCVETHIPKSNCELMCQRKRVAKECNCIDVYMATDDEGWSFTTYLYSTNNAPDNTMRQRQNYIFKIAIKMNQLHILNS